MGFDYKKAVLSTYLAFFSLSVILATNTHGLLSSEEIALFYKQGYLLKPKCFSEEEMKELRIEVDAAIERSLRKLQEYENQMFLKGANPVIYIDGSRIVCKRRSVSFYCTYQRLRRHAA